MEFAYLFPEDLGLSKGNLLALLNSEFYAQNGFGVRVYRRRNIGDYKDMQEGVTAEDMEFFVFRSTFVGVGPDIIRPLNPENTMKFFSQQDPGLILFYEPQKHRVPAMELELAFDSIQHLVLVLKADIHDSMTQSLAGLLNL